MAGKTTTSRDNSGHAGATQRETTVQLNALIGDVDVLRAALADTNETLNALIAAAGKSLAAVHKVAPPETPADLSASKVGNESGTPITE